MNIENTLDMNLTKIKEAISKWKTIADNKKSGEVISYFNQGIYFNLTKEQFSIWSSPPLPKYIHLYLAVNDSDELIFVLIDSISDKSNQHDTHKIVTVPFLNSSGSQNGIIPIDDQGDQNLDTLKAYERIFRWYLYKGHWAQKIGRSEACFFPRAFRIPYEDFQKVFLTKDETMGIFGLKFDSANQEPFTIEIIISESVKTYIVPKNFNDVSAPVPPFGGSGSGLEEQDFMLLQ